MSATIAALFVDPAGPYMDRSDVDPWDARRDARLYAGPLPVVAHPPCERWGRYAAGGPSARARLLRGDDGGCFAAALAAVRRWGGVLEHPAHSSAWAAHGMIAPPREGGWIAAGDFLGWTCCVEQGHYGHRARKGTWLYASGVSSLPSLRWGSSAALVPIDMHGYSPREVARFKSPPSGMTLEERARRRRWLEDSAAATGKVYCCPELMGERERRLTPAPFAELLLAIARVARPASERGRFAA
jgi:hypothetical protein